MATMNGGQDQAFPAWSRTVEETLTYFNVDEKSGLSGDDVKLRRKKFGLNELEHDEGTPFWKLVLAQFEDTLVRILLAAAAVSFLLAYLDNQEGVESGLTAYVEPLVILLILVLNACVGVWQESNAERALEALKEMQPDTAKVIRDGQLYTGLLARQLVPGDIVELRVGDKVPADMRLVRLHCATLRVEQASLTGEAVAVLKSTYAGPDAACELQAKDCMVFAGTTVVSGSCLSVVVTTGMQTEIGKIQQQIAAAAAEEDDTPLKKKLDEFGERLTYVIGAICLLVWLINYRHFVSFTTGPDGKTRFEFSFAKCTYYFKIAVALAVAAIPEGLPAVITTCLALGTRKMAAKNAIVRKLPSVETLGCTTVICSDKTGTLTTNQMSVTRLVVVGDSPSKLAPFTVQGTTYDPTDGGIVGFKSNNVKMPNIQALAEVAALCNDSGVEPKGGQYKATGLPTEAALRVLVEKIGVVDSRVQKGITAGRAAGEASSLLGANKWYSADWSRSAVLEFDRTRKSMGVICQHKQTKKTKLFVKGAVENVLERCSSIMLSTGAVVPLDSAARAAILQQLNSLASQALRCLALASTDSLGALEGYDGDKHAGHKLLLEQASYPGIESGMTFLGMVGLEDPPRAEVAGALRECGEAGIRVMVITGDNKDTAEAVCREIGLFARDEDISQRSFLGREFLALPEKRQRELLMAPGGKVFSRAEPKHKQDIVRLLKEEGEVVAMTGDGVNDAPALKLADIGVAMGIAGTEVAKEASDMVLADDNFSTIVSAVAEGRSIYDNMKAFIRYMISSNMGEVACIFLTAALGMPENLIPVQLLWVNLVTDGPPATALGFNPPDLDIMKKPPRRSEDKLITAWVFFRYLVIGAYVGIATVGVFAVWYTRTSFLGIDLSHDGHSTVTFDQLRHWGECRTWGNFTAAPFTAGGKTFSFDKDPCDYFEGGKVKATTLSLSVLVAIEMFNSLNALSEDTSLLRMPPWVNPWLLVAMAVSFLSHFVILYVPFFAEIFGIVPLSVNEWLLVLAVSLPVILIDELLKKVGRSISAAKRASSKLKTE